MYTFNKYFIFSFIFLFIASTSLLGYRTGDIISKDQLTFGHDHFAELEKVGVPQDDGSYKVGKILNDDILSYEELMGYIEKKITTLEDHGCKHYKILMNLRTSAADPKETQYVYPTLIGRINKQ